jgi:hypothetical protein
MGARSRASVHIYFMKGSFNKYVQGKFTGRPFPLFTIDGFVTIMYDNPVFVKKI